ncbi:AraC family transcriptional regulator [Kibdelosporangium phytohabitans]|uniref:AraC family transcriptional regulator n=1 Tax=Kibdelosporangium phytohabitans TaxID=860235 RepID=A0A0N9I0D4_9PSEU|nr:AraC family transcriptional regulator [Kibdelosporangium phytohabitans]ALG09283.1 AraC family transcriptional regulator [Kibdelosporangium phytohabitans]MBE1469466.1 AraC-like DNA-binding protein [Kibdelosporangium phytohabitans]
MDVLSDVIAIMRTGRPRSTRISWRAPWGHRFPSTPGSAGFQVVLKGACWFVPTDGPPVELSAGDIVFLPKGHGYGLADSPVTPLAEPPCDPGGVLLYASAVVGGDGAEVVTLCGGYDLDPARTHPILRELPDVVHLPERLGHAPGLRAAVDMLTGEIERPGLGADTLVTSLLDVLQLYIFRAWFGRDADCTKAGWAAALADPAMCAALDAIHRDPARRWTVQSLAAEAGLSRAAFAQKFTRLVGRAPLTYLTWWRLALGASLLRERDVSIAQVAQRVGYGSEYAFGTAFKREYGMSPGRYHRQACPA